MSRLIRVFPRLTTLTPRDELAFIGDPPLFRPDADEVHVSITFTWDKREGERLAEAWSQYYRHVKLGGPAYGHQGDFVPGRYIQNGVTFTTRGCQNHCSWCLVPEREGKLIEIASFAEGHIIQDNNLLQTTREHQSRVYAMLKQQKRAAVFSGGLQASLVDDWVVEQLRGLRIEQLFLAADTMGALGPLERAIQKLSFLGRRKLRVYTMIGRESVEQAQERLETVWRIGGLPFAQLYQPPDQFIEYHKEWKELARSWSRPALMFHNHKELE